jgi:hypothetical protein
VDFKVGFQWFCVHAGFPTHSGFDGFWFDFGFFFCGFNKNLQQANGKKRKQNENDAKKKIKFRALNNLVDKNENKKL